MLILFSKLFSKTEKQKTEIDDWFSFFWRSENEWPFDTRINKPCKYLRYFKCYLANKLKCIYLIVIIQ